MWRRHTYLPGKIETDADEIKKQPLGAAFKIDIPELKYRHFSFSNNNSFAVSEKYHIGSMT